MEVILGSWGRAFDGPRTQRAYTYKEQPGNEVAWLLGSAVREALKTPGGDPIDLGLSLLRELELRGLGVFTLNPPNNSTGER